MSHYTNIYIDDTSKKNINDLRILRIKTAFGCEAIRASMNRKIGKNGHVVMHHARDAGTLSAGIKCRHCMLQYLVFYSVCHGCMSLTHARYIHCHLAAVGLLDARFQHCCSTRIASDLSCN